MIDTMTRDAVTFEVRCQPGIEFQVINAVRSTVHDPDIFPYRFGEVDESPLREVTATEAGPGMVRVAVVGNPAYFDGEIEIMRGWLQGVANHLRAGLW